MDDGDKTREQLINELDELRQHLYKTALPEAERSQDEEMFWKSFKKYTIEAITDILHQNNREGRFIYTNEDSVYIFGYSLDEVFKSIPVDLIMYLKVVKVLPCPLQTRFNYN